ncbi:MAG: AMP-binding protein, partial [Cyclobacteriaceae bacterium]
VKKVVLDGHMHQTYPFDKLVEKLGIKRDISRNPLFDIQVIVQDTDGIPQNRLVEPEGLRIKPYQGAKNPTVIFDLVFNFLPLGDELVLNLEYNSDIYNEVQVTQYATHLERWLEAIAKNPELPLYKLEFLSNDDKQRLLNVFNNTECHFEKNKTIVTLFRSTAARYPEQIAVSCQERVLTYRRLDERSDQLAAQLINNYTLKSGSLVGVMLERSEMAVIAILAILKSKCAYVAVDPQLPKERQQFILQDAQADIVITQTEFIFDLEFYQGNVFAIDVQFDNLVVDKMPYQEIQEIDLAYVIYTSGSTGKPKGVMVSHGAIANTIQSQQILFEVNPGYKHLQFASLSFDASISEMFVCFASGGALF